MNLSDYLHTHGDEIIGSACDAIAAAHLKHYDHAGTEHVHQLIREQTTS